MQIRPILSALRRHKLVAALVMLAIALSYAVVCNVVFLIAGRIEHIWRPSGLAEQEIVYVEIATIGEQDNLAAVVREDMVELRALPGVRAASITNAVTFVDRAFLGPVMLLPDQRLPTLKEVPAYAGDEQLLDALGVHLVAGRDFTADEYAELEDLDHTLTLPPAVIITRRLADRLFPGENPLGKSLYYFGDKQPLRVVGIADRLVHTQEPSVIDPDAYEYSMILPLHLYTAGSYLLRVRDPAQRRQVLQAAVDVLRRNSPNRMILGENTLEEARSEYYAQDRSIAWLLTVVCGIVLVATAGGNFGLISFWVQQRRRQIGIRRALGATRGQILRYFQIENFLLTTAGIILGTVLAYGLNGLLMQHYELPRLPWQYLPIGAVVLWVLGQLAVLGPALRAAAVPPAVATRGI